MLFERTTVRCGSLRLEAGMQPKCWSPARPVSSRDYGQGSVSSLRDSPAHGPPGYGEIRLFSVLDRFRRALPWRPARCGGSPTGIWTSR